MCNNTPSSSAPSRPSRWKTPRQAIQRHTLGLSLAEVLISLAISSMLLVGMATAFNATGLAMENNERFFRANQAARVATNQFMAQVRRCTTVKNASSTLVQLLTYDGFDKTWKYIPAAGSTPGQLVVIDNATATQHILADNVAAARFTNVTGTDANNHTVYAQIGLTLTIKVGNDQVIVSGAAAPRTSLLYN